MDGVARYSAGDPAVLGRPRHEKDFTVPHDIVEQSDWHISGLRQSEYIAPIQFQIFNFD